MATFVWIGWKLYIYVIPMIQANIALIMKSHKYSYW